MFVLYLQVMAIYATIRHGVLLFLKFCLNSYKFDVSSQEFMWEDWEILHVRISFYDIVNSQMQQKR